MRRRSRVRKRLLWKRAAILAVIALALFLLWPAERPPRNPDDLCAIFSEKRHWYASARRSYESFGVPEAVQLAVIYQESSFRARALPPRKKILWILPGPRPSSAYGYTQALDSTWEDFRNRTGRQRARRDNFDDAAYFVGWYATELRRLTGITAGDVASLYLAYHEGPGGFARGSHLSQEWLLATASRVAHRADTYQKQYDLCEDRLGRHGWWRIWLLILALTALAIWLDSKWRRRRSKARRTRK